MRASYGFTIYMLVVFLGGEFQCHQNATESPSSGRQRILSRKRRFLLFPPGAAFIVTISGAKGSMFETPRGYNLVIEYDMYHPLPDYLYHASTLRLGDVAMYPDETTPKPPIVEQDASSDHVLSSKEVEQYLSQHPDTWVPSGWGNDRADWGNARPSNGSAVRPPKYQSWKSKLWQTTGNDRLYYNNPSIKRMRTRGTATDDADGPSFWAESNHLNISQHLGWEHYHHYRDRRSLYDHLASTIPSLFGFHMKECLLRSICEARNLLPPKGRSMTVDILRVIFTYPLREELSDEYSRMMRTENVNCRSLFANRCPLSILQLILFGKFEL